MNFFEFVELIKGVVFSPYVIAVTIIVIIYLNLVFYVANYRKSNFVSRKTEHKTEIAAEPEQSYEEDENNEE